MCDADLDRDAKLDLLMGLIVGPRLGLRAAVLHLRLPRLAGRARALEAGFAAGRGALRAVSRRSGIGERISRTWAEAANSASGSCTTCGCGASRGQPQPPLDERLLAALAAGLPDCAGVALGFDRLAAIALAAPRLADAMAFTIDNA